MHVAGTAQQCTCVSPHAHAHTCTHTHTHARTVTGRASPSLPRLRGCLFRRGVLAARPHLELRRVLGGRGDLVGPGRGEPLSPEERQASPQTPAPPRPTPHEQPHSPSDPRRPSHPSLREVLADPENRRPSDTQPVGMAPAPPPTSAASQLSAPKSLGDVHFSYAWGRLRDPVSELARGENPRSGQGFMDKVLIASIP